MIESLTYDDISLVPRVKSSVKSRSYPDTTIEIKEAILAAPIIASPMDTVCNGVMASTLDLCGLVGIIHRFQSIEEQVREVKLCKGASNVGIAVGVSGDYRKRLTSLISYLERESSNTKIWICFDTANGFTKQMEIALKWYKNKFNSKEHVIIAGNVASGEGYQFLSDLVDIVRVGIGSGSPCSTPAVAGVGQGMISTIMECNEARSGALILADGGIRSSGDISKALAVGADFVMCGSLFAGFSESPGEIVDGYKNYRGMASAGAAQKQNEIQGTNKLILAEGVEHKVPFKGPVIWAIPQLIMGLKTSMSYIGASNLKEFHNYFREVLDSVVKLTYFSQVERKPHIIK